MLLPCSAFFSTSVLLEQLTNHTSDPSFVQNPSFSLIRSKLPCVFLLVNQHQLHLSSHAKLSLLRESCHRFSPSIMLIMSLGVEKQGLLIMLKCFRPPIKNDKKIIIKTKGSMFFSCLPRIIT